VGKITAIPLRILESQHLHFEKQPERRLIWFGAQDPPEILKQSFAVSGHKVRREFLKARLHAGLDLLHDFGYQGFLRAEVMQQHARAGPGGCRQRAKGKIRDSMAQEVSEAFGEQLIARVDVTTVTDRVLPVKPGFPLPEPDPRNQIDKASGPSSS
jgi:hypothetical protein